MCRPYVARSAAKRRHDGTIPQLLSWLSILHYICNSSQSRCPNCYPGPSKRGAARRKATRNGVWLPMWQSSVRSAPSSAMLPVASATLERRRCQRAARLLQNRLQVGSTQLAPRVKGISVFALHLVSRANLPSCDHNRAKMNHAVGRHRAIVRNDTLRPGQVGVAHLVRCIPPGLFVAQAPVLPTILVERA
ncbi:MAG: hypothetical protein PWR07_2239 [Bacillota bacterium]|nr:hypothetical protein [Bacillota bacterium]